MEISVITVRKLGRRKDDKQKGSGNERKNRGRETA